MDPVLVKTFQVSTDANLSSLSSDQRRPIYEDISFPLFGHCRFSGRSLYAKDILPPETLQKINEDETRSFFVQGYVLSGENLHYSSQQWLKNGGEEPLLFSRSIFCIENYERLYAIKDASWPEQEQYAFIYDPRNSMDGLVIISLETLKPSFGYPHDAKILGELLRKSAFCRHNSIMLDMLYMEAKEMGMEAFYCSEEMLKFTSTKLLDDPRLRLSGLIENVNGGR
ncbi:MAG: hypothetical protein GYA55_06020 [SAR324 cluster bacterium]|uniref:Uncharacterized protein n=1 Tax=SAR324 cluster bacterium TaxID=2024889 RepID=A0A7X9FRV2_9DELT|nr:hypothetical protein [SAR324 cluster bacterium]